MKIYSLILSFLFSMQASAMMDHSHMDMPATHGMAIVGTHKIYLSHLPMFHAPHDYQVLLEVEFSNDGLSAYLKSKQNSSESLYTLVPEEFVLPQMVQHPHPFRAAIFKGHFERGGQQIADNVTVTITKVVYFKKFVPGDTKPNDATYLLFGNPQEQFLAHKIVSKPDFDQLLSVEVSSPLTSDAATEVVFNGIVDTQSLNEGAALKAEEESKEIGVKVKANLYLEFGDLSM